jgi:hypothetical protein
MIKMTVRFFLIAAIACCNNISHASEDGGHHLPHNHIAINIGKAYEETADGHHEDGHLLGISYTRQFHKNWGWGLTFEQEAFGENNQNRHAVFSIPFSYFINDTWRLFAGPGIEFRERGDPDKALLRFGTGYEFHIGKHFTLAPEAAVDFIAGGTKVYVVALSLGYGF